MHIARHHKALAPLVPCKLHMPLFKEVTLHIKLSLYFHNTIEFLGSILWNQVLGRHNSFNYGIPPFMGSTHVVWCRISTSNYDLLEFIELQPCSLQKAQSFNCLMMLCCIFFGTRTFFCAMSPTSEEAALFPWWVISKRRLPWGPNSHS